MIRFFPDEIYYVFPEIFNMEREDNQQFIGSNDYEILIQSIASRLKDDKFDAFRNM